MEDADAGQTGQSTDENCFVGDTCEDCAESDNFQADDCVDEFSQTVSFTGHPQGIDSLMLVNWEGGYCSPGGIVALGDDAACDPFAAELSQGCGSCGKCVAFESGAEIFVQCRLKCDPELQSSGCERDGYSCDLVRRVCMPGCTNDLECRLFASGTGDNGDTLWSYDNASDAVCNSVNGRCEHSGKVGAQAGSLCELDSECEANGICFEEYEGGGYCSKYGCDIEGNACADEGVCVSWGFASPRCLQPCAAGAEYDSENTDSWLGPDGRGQGCRAGYACSWAGPEELAPGITGGCVPGNYNSVSSPNIGAGCEDDADCYSPFGYGVCLNSSPWPASGYCSVFDCAAAPIPTEVACGTEAICQVASSEIDAPTLCLRKCDSAADCGQGTACVTIGNLTSVCYPTAVN